MSAGESHDVVVIGAGVSGIYQIKRLTELGFDAILVEADEDLGGTWYRNRYPGCRFDSESYTYGYSFSQELLDEWSWSERFAGQPENLRYLNYVAQKFDLRRHMRFNTRVDQMVWEDDACLWHLTTSGGATLRTRFVVPSLGPLSIPTLPRYQGVAEFEGSSFHTYHWPKGPIGLAGKRVGVVGTGATGIQVIAAIAGEVGELKVFQRRPNWSAPLNNGPIDENEMADIRARYPEIFAACDASPGGFEHIPRKGFWEHSAAERRALWDDLYDQPGFGIAFGNFMEVFLEEDANAELSAYIADRIRGRVDDPAIAEKLIPRDHGFATQRPPLETNYYEVYNRANVELVDISETPIKAITPSGVQTSSEHYDLDVIVYATGFDAITGGYDKIHIEGVGGRTLGDKWRDGPSTFVGVLTEGFPNLLMLAGPQSVGGSTNFPRAIQTGADWISQLLVHARENSHDRLEATPEAEAEWHREVVRAHELLLLRRSKGWFTGYNSNVDGHGEGQIRYPAYFGGAPRYTKRVTALAAQGYPGIRMSSAPAGAASSTPR